MNEPLQKGDRVELLAMPNDPSLVQDCTQFITPCCQKPADDRVWKSIPDIESIRLIPDSKLIKNS